jgi:hypothetical protein
LLVYPVIVDAYATALGDVLSGGSTDADLSTAALCGSDLLRRFASVSDGRGAGAGSPGRGRVDLVCGGGRTGMRSFTAIAGWVADVPAQFYRRPGTVFWSKTTLWRVLTGADAAAVDAAVGAWLVQQAAQRAAHAAGSAPAGAGGHTITPGPGSGMVAIAVDGKTFRGAIDAQGQHVHLLAAATHVDSLVLGQVEVGAKSNEVRREAFCRIPNSVRRNSGDSPWVRWLTWSRKVTGTRACHERQRPCSDARNDVLGPR